MAIAMLNRVQKQRQCIRGSHWGHWDKHKNGKIEGCDRKKGKKKNTWRKEATDEKKWRRQKKHGK